MKIKSFKYDDPQGTGWSLDELRPKEGLNLLVGASGSGKTRVLNLLFNIGSFAAQDRFANGQWTLYFEHDGVEYTWNCDSARVGDDNEARVLSEELWVGSPDHVETSLFHRNDTEFRRGDMPVPKLATTSTAVYLLREEPTIKPVHEAFSDIMRRLFWSEDLKHSVSLQPTPHQLVRKLERRPDISDIAKANIPLHVTLLLLNRYFPKTYALVLEQFIRVFPFVTDIRTESAAKVLNLPVEGEFTVALIKERGIQKPIPIHEIASGMQKVLLIITDVLTASPHVLYLIDEYENSLGVNAIDFLPAFLADCGGARQFIVTTHHPLLINAVPVSDWFVFHRKGLHIRVMHGPEIEARYGRSKQQRFTQLINDPLYAEGVE